jgi:hypothetical protein
MHKRSGCRQLLKYIEVSDLGIQLFRKLIAYSTKQTILIKIVISNMLTGTYMQFVIQKKKGSFGFNCFFG